ncbi:DEAD/DEAH box helicase [Mycobacterium simiae]|uniref:DEAD/DEAH box helicase n=1 Tax=Mycobacterium simiae TaxID=1784 RepID=A0A5B1BMN3_MYCSI|nr:DEAD/DEAH box helicase [Mycobacterium simiae]KAA1248663.1 DEAD/DEAH box helicase [Mycobacterium simiae]
MTPRPQAITNRQPETASAALTGGLDEVDHPVAPIALALRPHQQAAFDAARRHLGEHDRVTIVLPCGTGKTLLGQRLAQDQACHGRSTVLVLVPTRALLKQTVDVWVKHSRRRVAAFVFCHDSTAGFTDHDGVRVSTSPGALAEWVARRRRANRGPTDAQIVVFATYQSSPRIADAHRYHHLQPWHAVVADEAHRCAGQYEAAFATVVDDTKIPAGVRIFLTATLRVRKGAAEAVFCMDDAAAFGPVVAPLSVREAIDAQLLSDYLIVVVAVSDDQVRDAITPAGSDVRVGDHAVPVERVAAQLAVAAAARTYGLRRMMVFHNSVAESKAFTTSLPAMVNGRVAHVGELAALHIDGGTSARRRAEDLEVLADPGAGRWAVLSNVRCLGEGIDVPALDGVVFAGPRTSQLDITQCVGRALRLDPGREDPAVVVLPALVDADADIDAQVAGSRFRHVYRTLLALADHDSELAAELASTYRHGRGSAAAPGGERGGKVEVLDVSGTLAVEELYGALQLRALRLLTPNWEFGFQQLQDYVDEHGDARVPSGYVTAARFPLGAWVRGNRRRRALLTPQQSTALESQHGWVWNLHEAAWEEAFARLRAYIDEHGHAHIPRGFRCDDGFALDQWASVQRSDLAAGRLSADREERLRALKGFSLRPRDARFEAGLSALGEFVASYQHACPAQSYVTPSGFRLGQWVHHLRRRRNQLNPEQAAAVQGQPGWQWDVRDANWHNGLRALAAFKATYGHLQVPRSYLTPHGEPLGKWLDNQKMALRARTLPLHRRAALAELDPVWFAAARPRRLKGAPIDPADVGASLSAGLVRQSPPTWKRWVPYAGTTSRPSCGATRTAGCWREELK